MTVTRRGRLLAWSLTGALVIAAAAAGVVALGDRTGSGPLPTPPGAGRSPTAGPSSSPSPPPEAPPVCPLTGERPERGRVPDRPALAVKVENLPSVRPQIGLSWADLIYEEPVEGGITRFIAVYQCRDASRIQPVRSARLTDVDVLVQLGRPILGYAGAVREVEAALRQAGIRDFSDARAPQAYHRDPERDAPHNLYTGTRELYRVAGSPRGAPQSIFRYSAGRVRGRKVQELHLPFSSSSDVYWRWDPAGERFLRWHGDVPHTYSDGSQVAAANVVVQVVEVRLTDVVDANGVRSPFAVTVGRGKAYVLRGGKVIRGEWVRPTRRAVTRFVDRKGREITLVPGTTWVELYPSTLPVALD